MNGNRAHLQTLGMTKSNFDPTAYKFESTDVDEYFIEGALNLSAIVKVEKI